MTAPSNPMYYTFSGRRFNEFKKKRVKIVDRIIELRTVLSTCTETTKIDTIRSELLLLQEQLRIYEDQMKNFLTLYGGLGNLLFPVEDSSANKKKKIMYGNNNRK